MATTSLSEIELAIKRAMDKALPTTLLNKANIAVQKEIIPMWQKQLSDGIDADGKRIPKYSSSYSNFKRKYVNGGIKHRPKSRSKTWYKDLYTTTEFRATSNKNYGRLTGKFFSSMAIKNMATSAKNGVISLKFKLFVNNRKRAAIVDYLAQRGRKYGLALGNSNRGRKHIDRLLQVACKVLFPKATFHAGTVRVK